MAAPAYMNLRTIGEWKAYLQKLVRTNDKALFRSVLAIYDRQTPSERTSGQSTEDNGVGFTKWDAEEMSEIAIKIKNGLRLSSNEIVRARITMPKYWRQLMDISKATVAKRIEEEYNILRSKEVEKFTDVNNAMVKCMEDGIACEYGICDECIVNRGVQIHV